MHIHIFFLAFVFSSLRLAVSFSQETTLGVPKHGFFHEIPNAR